MRRSQSSHFTLRQDGEATVIDIIPTRPNLAFVAAAVLLGGLFGLPALAVVLNPARRDALSLSAALLALLVVAIAVLAVRRARANRKPSQLRLDAGGLRAAGTLIPWAALGPRHVILPDTLAHAQAPGIHGLAATIATRQRAGEARLLQSRKDGAPAVSLASGLDADTATRLDVVLAETAARYIHGG
jgi:hypothetical protein